MLKARYKIFLSVLFFVVAWYVFICSMHLYQQRPLWNDEIAVFESVENYSARKMFSQPLMAVQVFPRTYLYLIQQFSKAFDFSLWSLRLPSFICMITAFFLWLKIAQYGLKDRWQYLAFVFSWPASGMLLYYSAELKQYSMDVLVAALFILFLYNQENLQKNKARRYTLFLILLPSLGLFSYPAFIIAAVPMYNLIVAVTKEKKNFKYLCLYGCSFMTFAILSYFIDMRWRPTEVVTQGLDYFISFSSVPEFFRSLGEGTNNLFSRWFVEYPKFFKALARIWVGWGLIYMFYGFFTNRKKEGGYFRSLETIAFVLFLLLFFIGCLKIYWFTVPRTSLFYAPIVLYMTAKGIGLAARIHPYFYRLIMGLYFVFLGFLIIMQSCVAFWWQLGFYPRLW